MHYSGPLRRLLSGLSAHQQADHHRVFDPVAYEEEAMAKLYGERTGLVSASPTSPPVRPQDPGA